MRQITKKKYKLKETQKLRKKGNNLSSEFVIERKERKREIRRESRERNRLKEREGFSKGVGKK